MVPTQSLHRENFPIKEQLGRLADAGFTSMEFRLARMQVVARPTARTSHWLRMKTAIARISILSIAVVVQRPAPHGGVGPVVGKTENHAVPRTAVRTVDVGIPEAAVG